MANSSMNISTENKLYSIPTADREAPELHTKYPEDGSSIHQQDLRRWCNDQSICHGESETAKTQNLFKFVRSILVYNLTYQATQTSDVLEHQPSIAGHLENSCSEMQHIKPSSAACFINIRSNQ